MALAALPAEGMASLRMPSSTAMETAQERPRALNEPVGLRPSSFTHKLFGAEARAQARGGQERGHALAERDDRGRLGRQHRSVAPHGVGAALYVFALPGGADGREIVVDQQRAAALAQVEREVGLEGAAAEAALESGGFAHGKYESISCTPGGPATS